LYFNIFLKLLLQKLNNKHKLMVEKIKMNILSFKMGKKSFAFVHSKVDQFLIKNKLL